MKTTQDSTNEVFADPTNPKPDSSDHAYSQSAEPKPDFSDDAYPEPAEPDSSDEIFSEIRYSEEFLPEEAVLAEGTSLSFLPLTRIGINVQLGLDYCCGEEDFYMEMLQMFYSQAAEKKAELVDLFEASNWNDYTVKVHALKSTSMTIGAEQLAEQAKLLEQAGKKGNIGYIQHDHPNLIRMYDKVCETIAGL